MKLLVLIALFGVSAALEGGFLRGGKECEAASRKLLSNILPYGPVSPGTLTAGTLLTVRIISGSPAKSLLLYYFCLNTETRH